MNDLINEAVNSLEVKGGLILSRAADKALRRGDLAFLEQLFMAVEKAPLCNGKIRALLTNTRDAGIEIDARNRLIDRICREDPSLGERLR